MQARKKPEPPVFAELDNPSIICGKCRFTSNVEGEYSVEDGRLVFRADPDPQPRRGPDFTSCGECGARFTQVRFDWGRGMFTKEDLAAIQATAVKVREQEWTDWQKEYG